jgi:hypothetical protein
MHHRLGCHGEFDDHLHRRDDGLTGCSNSGVHAGVKTGAVCSPLADALSVSSTGLARARPGQALATVTAPTVGTCRSDSRRASGALTHGVAM